MRARFTELVNTLLLGGEASHTAGQKLAALSDELLEQVSVLVINRITGLDQKAFLKKEEVRVGESVEGDNGSEITSLVDRHLVVVGTEPL